MVEDRELWEDYKRTGSLELREKIVIQYIPLVKYVVGKIVGNLPKNIEYDDLVEYGIIGLLDAVDKYDITKNINFKTYAVTRIRGSVFDQLRVQDWVPRSVRKMAKDIEKAYIAIEKETGIAASEEQVAKYLDIKVKQINDTFAKVNMGNVSSLDDIIYQGDDSSTSRVETVENTKVVSAQESLEKQELKAALIERLKELNEKERLVITLYYYEQLTLKEIGQVMEISESRVSQIHSKAVLKMRSKLANKFQQYKGII